MKYVIIDILKNKNIDQSKFSIDDLYKIGMDNIMNNIEFYYNKPYTCESVLKELFIQGILNYVNKNVINEN